MLKHPLSIAGWAVFAVGFCMLLAWVPTAVDGSGFGQANLNVYNAHKAEISKAVMLLGGVMAVIGTIAKGFEMTAGPEHQISTNIRHHTPVKPASSTNLDKIHAGIVKEIDIFDRQGNKRVITVSKDGTATVETSTGVKSFSSLSSAKDYFYSNH